MYEEIKISPLKNDRYVLLDDFVYKDIVVPKGYVTNGADIPRVFWSFWPPNRSEYLPAVVVHDYLCDAERYPEADKYFKEILNKLNVKKSTVFLSTAFVGLYHRVRYGKK